LGIYCFVLTNSFLQRLNQCNDEALASLHMRPKDSAKPPRLADLCVLAFDMVNNSRHCFNLVLKVKVDEGMLDVRSWRMPTRINC
jgi:hypothetical protein